MAMMTSSVTAPEVPGAGPEASSETVIIGDWKHSFDNDVFDQYESNPTNPGVALQPVYTVCNFPAWSGSVELR